MLIASAVSLHAATRDKADNAVDLNLTNSWVGGLVPGSVDVARFNNVLTGPITVALGADTAWNQISFNDPAGDVTISGGNMLTLSNNTPIIFGATTTNLTLNCDVSFAGTAFSNIRSPAGQTLTLNGVLDGRDVAVTLGNSAGTILLSNPNTVRIGSVVQVSTAGMRLGIGASSLGDPISSGPLGTNLFTWASSSALTELFAYNGNQTLGNPLRLQFSPLNFNSPDDLTFTGVADFNNGTRVLNVPSPGALRFTGTISNATGLTKTGIGVLELGGTNVSVWNGGLSIFGGTVRLLNDDVIPDGGSAGTIRMTNTTEVLDMNGFSDTVRGLASPVGAGMWGGTLDNTAPSTTSVLTLGDNFTYTLAGLIQNSGLNSKLALEKIGTGGLVLTNANTFSGGITNASGGIIFINGVGAAGVGPIAVSTPDPLAELSYSGGGSLVWTNDLIVEAGARPIISASDGNSLEIASAINGPGQIWCNGPFGKKGALTFSGDSSFTGGFVLSGGLMELKHPRATGRGQFSIGDLSFFAGASLYVLAGTDLSGANALTNAVLISRDFTLGGTNAIEFAGPVTWITNSTQRSINVTNPAGITISGPMNGYGFNKNGAGVLRLNAVCSHNGPSTASSGPLALGPSGDFTGETTILIGSAASFDVSAVGNFTVKTTQALRVDGGCKIIGNVTINGALTNSSLVGSATFSNNLTLTASSTNVFSVSHFVQTGTNLTCLGTLSYGGNLLVNNFGSTLEAGDSFKLFDFTGNPGSFDTLTLPTLDAGLDWDISTLAVDGTIRVGSTTTSQPQLTSPQLLNGTNFVFTATGGVANGQFRVLTQTNVTEPMTNWATLSTNTYDGSGSLTVTNPVNPAEPQRFFRNVQP